MIRINLKSVPWPKLLANFDLETTSIMMKKTTLLFAICALLVGTSNSVDAQKYQGESVVTLGAGYSLIGGLIDAIGTDVNVAPALLVSYDYAISDNFTLGAALSYQPMNYTFDNAYYVGTSITPVEETVKVNVARINIGIRPLFHFGNNDDVDWYTGLRIGYQSWSFKNDSNDPALADDFNDLGVLSRPTVQPLLGMRYFFTQNIGMNMELTIGSPYIAMIGANFRF